MTIVVAPAIAANISTINKIHVRQYTVECVTIGGLLG
jgi:hypothetical protein